MSDFIPFLILVFLVLILIIIICWSRLDIPLEYINSILSYDNYPREIFYYKYDNIFPTGKTLEKYWIDIRNEGYDLIAKSKQHINYLNNYNIDLGKENKTRWTTYPLKIFGRLTDNINKCPTLKKILHDNNEILSCMYSLMAPGKVIETHRCPYHGFLRYQLALDIPNSINTENCYLHVNNIKYFWKNGTGIVFDETFPHGSVNLTPSFRLVLLIDIHKSYNNNYLRLLNNLIISLMSFLPSTIKTSIV